MKKLLLIFCGLILTINLSAQSKKSKKPIYFLKVQTGLLYDLHPESNFLGFNQLNVSWAKFQNDKINEISLELLKYTTDLDRVSAVSSSPFKLKRIKTSFELEYYKSLLHKGKIKNGFYMGPTASLRYMKTNFSPNMSTIIKYEEIYRSLGLGAKAVYYYTITKGISLNLSTKITLLDLGVNTLQDFNPTLTLRQQSSSEFKTFLLRKQFALLVGINFKL